MPDRRDTLDPQTQECLGIYLYGSGYFLSEDRRTAIVRGQHTGSFCNECPKQAPCWEQHRERVAETRPADVERFLRLLEEGKARGVSGGMIAAALAQQGKRDPYMDEAIENFKAGAAARRRVDLLRG